MKKTRTQLRGVCAICGKQFATQDGVMVAHGYTLAYGQQTGECLGVGQFHYGDVKSLVFLKEVLEAQNNLESKNKREASKKAATIDYLEQRTFRECEIGLKSVACYDEEKLRIVYNHLNFSGVRHEQSEIA